jgi:hypothetical protein
LPLSACCHHQHRDIRRRNDYHTNSPYRILVNVSHILGEALHQGEFWCISAVFARYPETSRSSEGRWRGRWVLVRGPTDVSGEANRYQMDEIRQLTVIHSISQIECGFVWSPNRTISVWTIRNSSSEHHPRDLIVHDHHHLVSNPRLEYRLQLPRHNLQSTTIYHNIH